MSWNASTGLCIAVAAVFGGSPLAAQQRAFDPLRFVAEDRISSGTYSGAYVVAPAPAPGTAAHVDWYFANLGLRAFVRNATPQVRAYLDRYIASLQPDRTIRNVDLIGDRPVLVMESDSDDSYAATFISLAVAYARASGDRRWFVANRPVIEDAAAKNLIQNRNAQGLIYNRRDPKRRAVYLEDNAEDYRGLKDLADYLALIGDANRARFYAAEATTTLRGIRTLYDSTTRTWSWTSPRVPLAPGVCYPDAASQVFAEAYAVAVPVAWNAAGYAYLNRDQPAWATSLCGGFPWMLLGYVAALRQDTLRARAKLAQLERLAADPRQRGLVQIHELGWYRLIQDTLRAEAQRATAQPLPDGHYGLRSVRTPLCMDLRSQDNTRVQLSDCKVAEPRQSFYFGRRDAQGFYLIHAVGGGQGNDARYVLDAGPAADVVAVPLGSLMLGPPGASGPIRVAGGVAGGPSVARATPWLASHFRWAVKRGADGTYALVNVATDRCIDAKDQDLQPGGAIQSLTCNQSLNQRWVLTKLD